MEIVKQSAILWTITPRAEQLIELAGRVCWQSEGENKDFIGTLIRRGHESVLEHASATFLITCDRGITHELVRHRIASYSQESTRYVQYDNIKVIEPPGLDAQDKETWSVACHRAEAAYANLVRCQPVQIARAVLPTCLAAQIVMTANMREWRHVLKLRLARAAHPQMRSLMKIILAELMIRCPRIFGDITCDE